MEPFIRTGFSQPEGGTLLVRLASRAVVCLLGSLVAGLCTSLSQPSGYSTDVTEQKQPLTHSKHRPSLRSSNKIIQNIVSLLYKASAY